MFVTSRKSKNIGKAAKSRSAKYSVDALFLGDAVELGSDFL